MADVVESDATATVTPEEPRGASLPVTSDDTPRKALGRMERVADVTLSLTVEIGRANMAIGRIVSLDEGHVVSLDKLSGESVDICINNEKLAIGEIIVIQDKIRVRVIDILDHREEDDDADA